MMVLHPEIQARAQAEIDAVVGDKRLPSFDDRESLPYIDALYRELMRFHGPAPLGEPSKYVLHHFITDHLLKVSLMPLQKTTCIMGTLFPKVSDRAGD
jgi:cytochrome P450